MVVYVPITSTRMRAITREVAHIQRINKFIEDYIKEPLKRHVFILSTKEGEFFMNDDINLKEVLGEGFSNVLQKTTSMNKDFYHFRTPNYFLSGDLVDFKYEVRVERIHYQGNEGEVEGEILINEEYHKLELTCCRERRLVDKLKKKKGMLLTPYDSIIFQSEILYSGLQKKLEYIPKF